MCDQPTKKPHRTHELKFRKSSYSATANDCVEVAGSPRASLVRDTQNRGLGTLVFGSAEWRAFLGSVKDSTR
ncbi:DUF397 domain-containing protein [Nocardiopsis algeriensis]|uniref:DUF397 domain-containing protein n=1 Tax=Nocardiopsis algeriensis TaxID=1478215 RepID=UPI003B436296